MALGGKISGWQLRGWRCRTVATKSFEVKTGQSFAITVGAGGAGGADPSGPEPGCISGANSVFTNYYAGGSMVDQQALGIAETVHLNSTQPGGSGGGVGRYQRYFTVLVHNLQHFSRRS